MKWIKKGLIHVPDGTMRWAVKHAFPPTPYFIEESIIRIYVAFCDEKTIGRVGYVDVSADDPREVIQVSRAPVLDVGSAGAFDENGVVPTSVISVGSKMFMYYVGYQLGNKVRYFQFQGLAESLDGGKSFDRRLRVPVIDRSDDELLNRTSAFVSFEGDRFKMWYVAGSEWTTVQGKPLPIYNLRYLESIDGVTWPKHGRVCIDFQNEDEHAFGRPWIVREGNSHKMFYSIRTRSHGYRLGYAESFDGIDWTRKDQEIGIGVSQSGWDSRMIAYASVVRYRDKVYMFYNGNDCGTTGFGYAILESW